MTLSFEQALSTVREKLSAAGLSPARESVALDRVRGRVLAADVAADRDYPPFHRSTRDGYAVRAADLAALPAPLECVGEVRAGEHFEAKVSAGQCVTIMTGAPLPAGADAVVMLEHTKRQGTRVEVLRAVEVFENVVRQGSESSAGNRVLPRGRRLGPSEMGLLATVGRSQVDVFLEPRVSIIPTGDEIVPVDQRPEWFQIRNSNAVTLAAQVAAAGGVPWRLDIAPDRAEPLRRLIEEGLSADLLLLSGGVSMGKYDFVERVLGDLGAEFFFQGVAIRPGKPLVFGRARNKFFFGLPGNPVSTFVTFELFVRPAIALLGGANFECSVFLRARLGKPFRQRLGLTAFMPARVEIQSDEPVVNLVGYQGSGDLVGVAAANCFLVVRPEQNDLAAGDWVDVLPKPVS
ncbi:MAG: molybdopterin molybdotransferase MoeA [Acidobacteria bacterium]|nr:molybdopterin molybdotransferase MoeA [Acidobacteriota bacterium]